MSFWSNADFAFQPKVQDSINEEIWTQSVNMQNELDRANRPPSADKRVRHLVQQTLLDPSFCRSSLVTREQGSLLDKPISLRGDDDAQKLFANHADCQREWTWKRLEHSRGCIIALGFTAEYGLLRLFRDKGCRIEDSATRVPCKFKKHGKDFAWTVNYPAQTIESRLNSKTFWDVEQGQRRWKLIPVYHPQYSEGRRKDLGYEKTLKFLNALV